MNRIPGRSGRTEGPDGGGFARGPVLFLGILGVIVGLLTLWIAPTGGMVLLFAGLVSASLSLRATAAPEKQGRLTGKTEKAGRKLFDPDAPDHNHIVAPERLDPGPVSSGFRPPTAPGEPAGDLPGDWTQRQLSQLETLKEAGLVDGNEYRARKKTILSRR